MSKNKAGTSSKSKIKNPDRKNGKAWKKSWGSNPPIEQSRVDSNMNANKKNTNKKENSK